MIWEIFPTAVWTAITVLWQLVCSFVWHITTTAFWIVVWPRHHVCKRQQSQFRQIFICKVATTIWNHAQKEVTQAWKHDRSAREHISTVRRRTIQQIFFTHHICLQFMSLHTTFNFIQEPFISWNIQIPYQHIHLVYNIKSNPAFCHRSFYKNGFSTFICYFILFCTDCIFNYFLIFLFIIWSILVQP